MKWTLAALFVSLAAPLYLGAQQPASSLQTEMGKVEALVADPDLKLAVVAAMADSLQVHRNHVLLLRKETGNSFAAIFVSELRARGMDDDAILHGLRAIRRKMDGSTSASVPVLSVSSGVDHNSPGTIYSLVPQIGFDSRHVAAVVAVPYYRISTASVSSGGLGDVYVSVFLRGKTAGFELGSSLTIGAPTGDRDRGLGAGKVTLDGTGTIARRLGLAKPWISAGFANSIFNNAGYQRPYVTDGNAAHFSGGVDFTMPHKVTFGAGGFGLVPVGSQIVYSQTVQAWPSGSAGGQTNPPNGGGMMPGGGMGPGIGGGSTTMPPVTSMPFYDQAHKSVVNANELRDYGPSIWLSVPLHSGLALNAFVTRSVAFDLTTVRVGVGIDVARLLFPGKHF